MATLFTKIIDGEIPGRFVWKDEHAVAFLTIAPLRPGHTLVVPRKEVDHWLDLEPALACHLTTVSQTIGRAIERAFRPTRVGLIIAGLEVPHVHLHVFPAWELADFDPARQDKNAKAEDLERAAVAIRDALRALGATQVAG
jgi:histidine triad (HIT) family protein